MRFNFIIDDGITVDPSYDYVLFGDSYVNQIDFKNYDNKTENNSKRADYLLKEKTIKILENEKKYLKDDEENFVQLSHEKSKISFDEDSDEDFACINLPTPIYMKQTVREMYKTNLTKKNLSMKSNEFFSITTNESTMTLQNMILSENEGNDIIKRSKSKKIKRVRTCSILKDRNKYREKGLNYLSKSTDSMFKKVTFGVVKYSY